MRPGNMIRAQGYRMHLKGTFKEFSTKSKAKKSLVYKTTEF